MTDHTPGPCGCRVADVGEFGYEPFGEHIIIYCPLHAAAPALLAAGSKVISLWEAMSQLRPERPWGFANDELDAAEVERMVELLDELSAAIAEATGGEDDSQGYRMNKVSAPERVYREIAPNVFEDITTEVEDERLAQEPPELEEPA